MPVRPVLAAPHRRLLKYPALPPCLRVCALTLSTPLRSAFPACLPARLPICLPTRLPACLPAVVTREQYMESGPGIVRSNVVYKEW